MIELPGRNPNTIKLRNKNEQTEKQNRLLVSRKRQKEQIETGQKNCPNGV
jgi:hypothetical protein